MSFYLHTQFLVLEGQIIIHMKKYSLALRTELDGVWYLEPHPQVSEYFKLAGVFAYCEKLISFHQQIAKSFAQVYNGTLILDLRLSN